MTIKIHYSKNAVEAFLTHQFPEIDWSPVINELPLIVWRSKWNTLADKYGLPYRRSYLQNLDSQGVGPSSFM